MAGAHPYRRLGPDTIDSLRLRSPGSVRMILDDQGIPVGTEPVDGTSYDFRAGKVIASAELDTGYSKLDRDAGGLAWVTLTDDSSGTAAGWWMDQEYRYLMLFAGDSFADPARRRRGLGVEPMTCPPNALQDRSVLAHTGAGRDLHLAAGDLAAASGAMRLLVEAFERPKPIRPARAAD